MNTDRDQHGVVRADVVLAAQRRRQAMGRGLCVRAPCARSGARATQRCWPVHGGHRAVPRQTLPVRRSPAQAPASATTKLTAHAASSLAPPKP